MAQRYVDKDVDELAPGLWHWNAHHPEWKQEVSSYALAGDDTLVLLDPLVSGWKALDALVERHGVPATLISVYWHVRSAPEILDRYSGSTLWAHKPALRGMRRRVAHTDTFTEGDLLPGGVEAIAMHHMNEAAFWLPEHRALLFGDSVVGGDDGAGLSPASWLRKGESVEEQRASVERALKRKPERLLLTHGGPTDPSAVAV
jgi:glyoxylase-like metal-dependent hydrolase (beta-lactamase superfamily II)